MAVVEVYRIIATGASETKIDISNDRRLNLIAQGAVRRPLLNLTFSPCAKKVSLSHMRIRRTADTADRYCD